MTEEEIVKARASAEMEIEPLLRIFKHTLIETYMKGLMKGMESMEDEVSEKFYQCQNGFGETSLRELRHYVKNFGFKLKEK